MARTHAHTHGKSHTNRPTSKNAPSWAIADQEIISKIIDFGKDGLSASEIGLRLRDEFAVPLVKPILGKTVTQVLEENNIGWSTWDYKGGFGIINDKGEEEKELIKILNE